MRRCKKCSFPKVLAKVVEWHSDGTVMGSGIVRIPFVFLGVDERESVIESISKRIEFPLTPILIEAQRNVGRELYQIARKRLHAIDISKIPENKFFRPQWLAKLIVHVMNGYLAATGMGKMEVESYQAGHSMTLRFEGTCLIPGLVGNCVGIYECLEKMPSAKFEYRAEDDVLNLHLEHGTKVSDIQSRLYFEEFKPSSGNLHYERCPKCGVPLELARLLAWDMKRGLMFNAVSGERMGIVAVDSLRAIVRELEIELGDEVKDMLYEIQKDYSIERMSARGAEDTRNFLNRVIRCLAVTGQGYPTVVDLKEDSIFIEINNAYVNELYAAKLAAALEVATGHETRIDWHERERRSSKFTLSVVQ